MGSTFSIILAAKLVGSVLTVADSAKEELQKGWSKYSADDKRRCVGQTDVGGMPSYVEVVECLQVTVDLNKPPSGDR
jgi:hypothetical protein